MCSTTTELERKLKLRCNTNHTVAGAPLHPYYLGPPQLSYSRRHISEMHRESILYGLQPSDTEVFQTCMSSCRRLSVRFIAFYTSTIEALLILCTFLIVDEFSGVDSIRHRGAP